MSASASSAMCGLLAATAATACPLYRALLLARMLFCKNFTLAAPPSPKITMPSSTSGISAAVMTALTPGWASA